METQSCELKTQNCNLILREQFNLVIVGHVDHGKSTVIGRLLADTDSLPTGKIEAIKERCRRNAKPFEYAFLLDALKDEQEQGITIDSARCFFKSGNRDYIIIDAPGHIEFLKNMISGASRADAALLVIDAKEGVQENSKRHGFILSLLGIKQISILVNKIDLVNYDMKIFEKIKDEYGSFLHKIGVQPASYIPVCARKGENIVNKSNWYNGITVLEQINQFSIGEELERKSFRMPIQAIYKFTERNDDRRIIAGSIETGIVHKGDRIIFYPSRKESRISTIETFPSSDKKEASAREAIGVTIEDELYLRPGEIMARKDESPPQISTKFKVQIFWMGHLPMIKNKRYKLKLASARTSVFLSSVESVLDAYDFSMMLSKKQIDRHDVATCIIETAKPIAYDLPSEIANTGRFVIVDRYEIAGAGIIISPATEVRSIFDEHVALREENWESSDITPEQRASRFGHKAKFILITGQDEEKAKQIGMLLEARLFDENYNVYYLGISNLDRGIDRDVEDRDEDRAERIRRLGELSRILTGSGQIFITAAAYLEPYEIKILRKLNEPIDILVIAVSPELDLINDAEIILDTGINTIEAVRRICNKLTEHKIIDDYVI